MSDSVDNSTNVPAPGLTRRDLGLGALASVVTALVMHWPLPLHLGCDVPRDLGDPLPQSWQVAWNGHALLHQPLDWFQANIFWPLHDSLAFSDALVGYAPAGLLGSGPHAAVVRYDVLFLLAYALAFFGAWLLARELGAGRAGAFVAGAAFAYAPWRLEQDGHLHVLSSGGIPLALALLVRGYRRSSGRTVLAGWLVAAWQVSLGFSLGIQFGYLLALLVLIAVAARLWPPRRVLVATAAGGLVLLATAAVLSRPYLRVADDHPEAERTSATVERASGPVGMYLAAPGANTLWGPATRGVRGDLTSVPEQTLFPGLLAVLLAVACLALRWYPRGLRIGLALGALLCAWLALGFHDGSFPWPYELLYQHAPGWESSRTPGRVNTLTSLALALLAAGGASALLARVRRPRLRAPLAAAIVVVVLVEGAGFEGLDGPAHPTVPVAPADLAGLPDPQLHLPISRVGNRRYMLWSTAGFPRIVNGRASFIPSFSTRLANDVAGFPDGPSVALLRSLGVRTVVVHTDLAPGTSWHDAAVKPVAGLGLRRERRGALVVYSVLARP
ncbi:MAG: hypothetical protein QOG63_129 [Thermoleophilaceae bacterium]|nr:hypothetical protein [Thermoleophilaceae bacterium]